VLLGVVDSLVFGYLIAFLSLELVIAVSLSGDFDFFSILSVFIRVHGFFFLKLLDLSFLLFPLKLSNLSLLLGLSLLGV